MIEPITDASFGAAVQKASRKLTVTFLGTADMVIVADGGAIRELVRRP